MENERDLEEEVCAVSFTVGSKGVRRAAAHSLCIWALPTNILFLLVVDMMPCGSAVYKSS